MNTPAKTSPATSSSAIILHDSTQRWIIEPHAKPTTTTSISDKQPDSTNRNLSGKRGAAHGCYAPNSVPHDLGRVTGRRWTGEEPFQAGKGLTGLDDHQLRRWLPWRR